MATTPKPGSGSTAPDDKTDARQPDTTADKRNDSVASVPTDIGVDETDAALNSKYGFATIDTSDVSHEAAEPGKPVPVDQPSGSAGGEPVEPKNSTFASRLAANRERQNTQATGVTSK